MQWYLTMLEKYYSERAHSTWNIGSGDETWVYQFDPETKAQSSVWLFPADTPPLKLKRSMSTSEQMVALYFAKTGHITTIPLEKRRTVTTDWYAHQCLPQVLHAVRARRPKSGITLHHDNAPAHTAATTREFLASEDVQLISHPPILRTWFQVTFSCFHTSRSSCGGPVMTVPGTRSEPSQGLLTV